MTRAAIDGRWAHLRAAGSSVVVDLSTSTPTIVHWGAELDDLDLAGIDLDPPVAGGAGVDVVAPACLVPEHGSGWAGRPGLLGARPDGSGWAPRFSPIASEIGAHAVTVRSADAVAALELSCRVALDAFGVLAIDVTLTNVGDAPHRLDGLTPTVAMPARCEELGVFTGRWARELHPVRLAFTGAAHHAENRRGRTSHDQLPLVLAGTPGFGEWSGEVWALHLAWSGNSVVRAERLVDGRGVIQLGALLHPGELELAPGQTYEAPTVLGAWSSSGLTNLSRRFHRHVRARANHPHSARPVLVNTWEAVYFDHDRARLVALADRAAAVGAERFVLDDGWFGARRNDRAGLGDWKVSPDAHPGGLGPLIDHVRAAGMQFGIWVEPEMANPDSEVLRAHPDWVLATNGYPPVLGRHQLVLDLGRTEVFDHVLARLDTLLTDQEIEFVKWDMNRDHVGGSGADGRAGSHRQTEAVYRLIDALRAAHPHVEIESCASGGGRIDLGILARTDRVWTSDCNDALERQTIQRGASILLPPELMGAHIGPPRSHTTGRTHGLGFRAITAMFGHLGIEWDLLELDERELAQVASVVALHRRFRPLLHAGDVVRVDLPGGATIANGVYATDRSEGLIAVVQLRTAPSLVPPPLVLPDLDPDGRYRVERLAVPGSGRLGPSLDAPGWLTDGTVRTGRALATMGLVLPVLHPESALLVHLERLGT